MGLAVDLKTNPKTVAELDAIDPSNGKAVMAYIQEKMEYLGTSRPTAVNLFNALQELQNAMTESLSAAKEDKQKSVRDRLCDGILSHAEFMLERDVKDNKAIGDYGAKACLSCLDKPPNTDRGVRLMTICNTGSLATAGFGTALGVARALHKQNKLKSIVALETRPYNQGSRLTAFEIVQEKHARRNPHLRLGSCRHDESK